MLFSGTSTGSGSCNWFARRLSWCRRMQGTADEENQETNIEKAKLITGVDNPNSPKQLKEWLVEQGIREVDSLSKADVSRLLKDATGNVEEILKLRQEIAKSSIKKYQAMQNVVNKDMRCRGLIQFYGANRTGRFAGRLIQVQNLPMII